MWLVRSVCSRTPPAHTFLDGFQAMADLDVGDDMLEEEQDLWPVW